MVYKGLNKLAEQAGKAKADPEALAPTSSFLSLPKSPLGGLPLALRHCGNS